MKAFILAAGQGKRLEPLTHDTPKCLVSIGGTTILEYQLVTLSSSNIKDIVIIAGFRADKIKEAVKRYVIAHNLDIRVKIIVNPEYDCTNNLYSLWLARGEINGDFAVINGDNVFERESLLKTLRQNDAHAVVAIHKSASYDNEDMKVRITGSHVIEISKRIDNNLASGESIGLRIFRQGGVMAFKEAMDEAMSRPNARRSFFVEAIQIMIDKGHHVGYTDVTEYQYGELDFPADLKHLEQSFSLYMIQNIYMYSNPVLGRRPYHPVTRHNFMKKTG